MLEKFASRKFLMALLSVVTGILVMFGIEDSIVQLVSSVGLIVIPTIIYIITEGKIDAEGVKKIIDTVEDVIDVIDPDEEVEK
jgi:hypothetical protein